MDLIFLRAFVVCCWEKTLYCNRQVFVQFFSRRKQTFLLSIRFLQQSFLHDSPCLFLKIYFYNNRNINHKQQPKHKQNTKRCLLTTNLVSHAQLKSVYWIYIDWKKPQSTNYLRDISRYIVGDKEDIKGEIRNKPWGSAVTS